MLVKRVQKSGYSDLREEDILFGIELLHLTMLINDLKSLHTYINTYIHTYIHRTLCVLLSVCGKLKHPMMTYGTVP